ncbi:MAG: RluA family pseudouridine synthase [Candidatus Babeliales bacterium]
MTQIQPNAYFSFSVNKENDNTRLDVFVTQQFSQHSRSFFKHLIEKGQSKINKVTTKKQGTLLKTGDTVTIQFPAKRAVNTTTIKQLDLNIQIISQHEHFLIVSKPAGLLVHPTSSRCTETTLSDWLIAHYNEIQTIGYPDRPGIIHRLDKDTSGLIIIPRTSYANTLFGQLFKSRSIKKKYYALVEGHPEKKGIINLPIGRDPFVRKKMKAFSPEEQLSYASKKIRSATTHYNVIDYFDDYSFIEVQPITGRTHQIRVHCAAIGHPIIGDSSYGTKSIFIKRQALHAQELSFTFNNKDYSFSSPLSNDFKNALKKIKIKK